MEWQAGKTVADYLLYECIDDEVITKPCAYKNYQYLQNMV